MGSLATDGDNLNDDRGCCEGDDDRDCCDSGGEDQDGEMRKVERTGNAIVAICEVINFDRSSSTAATDGLAAVGSRGGEEGAGGGAGGRRQLHRHLHHYRRHHYHCYHHNQANEVREDLNRKKRFLSGIARMRGGGLPIPGFFGP